MSTLEKKLNELIARQEDVTPNEVTLEFIREKRKAEVYPEAQFDFATNYGGHIPMGGRFYSPAAAKVSVEKAYKFLAGFSKKK